MELHRPFRVVTPTLDGDVLTALARVDAWFTPPQLHRVIGRHSEPGIRKALHRLVDQGIVQRQRAGRGDVYELNREHLASPYIVGIAGLFEEFLRRATDLLEEWAIPCEYAALFGSAATGLMRPDSDLDVFIVRPDSVPADESTWTAQVDLLAARMNDWTGNDARPLELSAGEVAAGFRGGREPVLLDIRREGIRLFGPADYLRAMR